MMLFFPLLLAKWHGRVTLLGLGIAVVLLVPLAWNRLWVFADIYRLWDDAAVLLPNEQVAGADRIFFNRAQAALSESRWEEAIADYRRAVALSPQLAPMRYELGVAYAQASRFQEAIVELDVAIALQPNVAAGYFAKGQVLMELKQREQALPLLKKSCDLGEMRACLMVLRM